MLIQTFYFLLITRTLLLFKRITNFQRTSMKQYIDAIKGGLSKFVTTAKQRKIQIRFSVAKFGDDPSIIQSFSVRQEIH